MALERKTTRITISGIAATVLMACAASPLRGQQLIGYVDTHDAEITGASDTLNGQAVLTGAASVTARDHTAPVKLGRGGMVRVCQTSQVHITESKSADLAAPLLFSLDRGAVEIQMNTTLNDAIMTPDLRFTIINKGPLDLRLRVARNGDTCVENRGPLAPTLNISDPFGEAMYQVSAGQHVLFEHGSLREVVDNEKYPCGCPEKPGLSVADALLASGGTRTTLAAPTPTPPTAAPPAVVAVAPAPVPPPVAPAPAVVPPSPAPQPAVVAATPQPDSQAQLKAAEQAAAAAAMRAAEEKHPFPAAISEGLAPAPQLPVATSSGPQITDTLSYNAPVTLPASPATPAATANKKSAQPAGATRKAPQSNGIFHRVGRFFKHLFGS
jgi:hypothetical protein